MYPHYFEKQKTDGVDYSIYAGGSLLEGGSFDPLYLRNLRLWQLMVACGIAIRADRLKDRLAVPLEVANLILVQHQPLAIRFRVDEKRFDVDGAYNVRYEIIKKRIDKAVVRGTAERLTQPGQDRPGPLAGQRGERVAPLHRLPSAPRLPDPRGGGARAGGAARRPGSARPARHRRPDPEGPRPPGSLAELAARSRRGTSPELPEAGSAGASLTRRGLEASQLRPACASPGGDPA